MQFMCQLFSLNYQSLHDCLAVDVLIQSQFVKNKKSAVYTLVFKEALVRWTLTTTICQLVDINHVISRWLGEKQDRLPLDRFHR